MLLNPPPEEVNISAPQREQPAVYWVYKTVRRNQLTLDSTQTESPLSANYGDTHVGLAHILGHY